MIKYFYDWEVIGSEYNEDWECVVPYLINHPDLFYMSCGLTGDSKGLMMDITDGYELLEQKYKDISYDEPLENYDGPTWMNYIETFS